MQVVSVFPHHHHRDAVCLHHEAETSRPADTHRGCPSECITRFHLTLPESSRVRCAEIGSCVPVCGLVSPCGEVQMREGAECAAPAASGRPLFYESRPHGGAGRRAPPVAFTVVVNG